MSKRTHRGTKNGRNTRNAKRINGATEQPTSRHRDVSHAFVAWRKSDDARTASIKFNEFMSQRPDLHLGYLPESWVRWMASRRLFVANMDDNWQLVPLRPADETEQHEIESVIAVIEEEAAFPQTVSLEDIVETQSAPAVDEQPAKPKRKSRAKKTDAVATA